MKENRDAIIDNICAISIVPLLRGKSVLTEEEATHITNGDTRKDKAERLSDIFMNDKDEESRKVFLSCLRESYQSHVARIIDPRDGVHNIYI